MVKRLCPLLLALMLTLTSGSTLAELKLWDDTPAQKALKTYISNVNSFLAENGEFELNHIFDQQDTVVELGITYTEEAYIPEGVDVTVYLYYGSINYLKLRVSDAARFPQIAGAFLQALNPRTMTKEEALKTPGQRAQAVVRNPFNSFEDKVEEEMLNGTSPRTFYSYYPNQYHDGVNWIQLLIIFPMEGFWDEENGIVTPGTETDAPYVDSDQDREYEGYYASDDYEHMEVFSTSTPEPDSAAAEYDPYNE